MATGQTTETFTITGSQTWHVPTGVTAINLIECWGAGGWGGALSLAPEGTGGGGGGAYASIGSSTEIGFSIDEEWTLVVGTPCAPIANTNRSYAGPSASGPIVRAVGGTSVDDGVLTGGSGGSSIGCIGDIAYSGGNGADGNESKSPYGGGGGGAAGSGGSGGNASTYNGGSSNDGGGGGGTGSTGDGVDATDGTEPGGGGGGIYSSSGTKIYSGAGGNGRIKITYTWESFDTAGYVILMEEFFWKKKINI